MQACLDKTKQSEEQTQRIQDLEADLKHYQELWENQNSEAEQLKNKLELIPIYEQQINELQEFSQSHGMIIDALTNEKLESDAALKKKQEELDQLLDTFQKNEETYNHRINDLEVRFCD